MCLFYHCHVRYLVAAVLVEDNQEDGHDHDDTDHDDGVQDGVEKPAAHRLRVLRERRVDPEGTNVRVSCGQSLPVSFSLKCRPTAVGRSSPNRS